MMFNMTTIDESFGASVTKARSLRGMSQKDLASALTERGMKVDASAVSRIEKGTRSVRLAEAQLISAALGRELSEMISDLGTLQERIFTAYDQIEWRGTDLADAATKFAQSLFALTNLVEGNDEQLAKMVADGVGVPASGRDVPRWYSELLKVRYWDTKRERVNQDRYVLYGPEDDIEGIREAIRAVVEPSLVMLGEYHALEEMGAVPMSPLDSVALRLNGVDHGSPA